MAIRKRSDTKGKPWQVIWREADRKQRSRSFGTRREAQAFEAEVIAAKSRGLDTPARATKVTMNEWLERWLTTYRHEWAATTLRQRAYEADKWIAPYLGNLRMGDLRQRTIRDYRAAILEDGCSPAHANGIMRILSSCLSAAAAEDLLPANPVLGIRALPAHREKARALTPLQIETIRAAMQPGRDRRIVSIMAYAGLRPAEVVGLEWRHVTDSVLHVEQSVQFGQVVSTKTRRSRTVPMSDLLAEELAGGGEPDSLVVTGDRGGFLDWHNWTGRIWRPTVRELGIDAVPYDLRHSYCSMALHEGLSLAAVAASMGHANQTTTLDNYSHMYQESQVATRLPMSDAIRAARAELAAR